jgi:sulfide:quinone oxidoreductase
MHRLGESLQWIAHNASHGRPQRVLFVVPPNTTWPGPAYEVALMLDMWLRGREVRHQVEITFATAERSFGEGMGPMLHRVLADQFVVRDIAASTDRVVTEICEQHTCFADGTKVGHDAVIAVPPQGPALRIDGLPADDRGFLRCRPETGSVIGHDEIFAPGDAGDFPVKQAVLALTQAATVASTIAGGIRGAVTESIIEPTALCTLDTLDRAIVAMAPLTATGGIRVDQDRVAAGVPWRTAKHALGLYVTRRYRAGRPVLTGVGWQLLNFGADVLSYQRFRRTGR